MEPKRTYRETKTPMIQEKGPGALIQSGCQQIPVTTMKRTIVSGGQPQQGQPQPPQKPQYTKEQIEQMIAQSRAQESQTNQPPRNDIEAAPLKPPLERPQAPSAPQAAPSAPSGMPAEMLKGFSNAPTQQAAPPSNSELSPFASKLAYQSKLRNELRSVWSEDFQQQIYYRDETLYESDVYRADLRAERLVGFVKVLFLRALDSEGNRLFRTQADYEVLMRMSNIQEITRVALEIFMADFDEETGNSLHESDISAEQTKNT